MAATRFEVTCPGAERVCLAGDFNSWDSTARKMKRTSREKGTFVAVVDLDPGRYEFKYIADGEWVCCPQAPRVSNSCGTENSVVEVCDCGS